MESVPDSEAVMTIAQALALLQIVRRALIMIVRHIEKLIEELEAIT